MKVLHFYRTYFPDTQGGLEEVIRQVCLATSKIGVENRVLTLSKHPSLSPLSRAEADVYQVQLNIEPASCSIGMDAFSTYEELIEWADLVHLHYPWPFADLVHLIKGRGTPMVITYHSDIVRQRWLKLLYRPLEQKLLNHADALVATSPIYLESSDNLKKFRDKTTVIPIGADENAYPQAKTKVIDAVEEKYGKDFFFFIGVLRYYKGLKYLIEAMKGKPYNLLIAGMGPEESSLKKQVESLGLSNVFFSGYVNDEEKMAMYHLSRAVVLPSCYRSEAYGVTLLEGSMLSKPLISTELGTGTSYVNVDGETGYVVAPGDCDALQQAMARLVDNESEARLMGLAARTRYERLMTGDKMGEKYHRLYRDVLLNYEATKR